MKIHEIQILFKSNSESIEKAEDEIKISKIAQALIKEGYRLEDLDCDDEENGKFIYRAVYQK